MAKTLVTIEHVEGADVSRGSQENPHCCHARHSSSSPRAGNPTINATSSAPTQQPSDAREKREKEREEKERKGERVEEERRKEGKLRKKGDEEIKKDVMGWTVVTRSKNQRKRVVQIFVKVDGMKTVLREVSARRQSPEDPENCEWKWSGRVRDVRGKDAEER